MDKAKEFLTYVVKSLVEYPDQVEVEAVADEMGVLLTLHVAKEDMGIVIGRQGNTANTLRSLLKVLGGREKANFGFKIYDPNPRPRYNPDQRKGDPLEKLI